VATNQGFEHVPVNYFCRIYPFVHEQDGKKFNKQQETTPTKKSKFHFNELEYMDEKCLFYVLKTSEIAPFDSETDYKQRDKVLKNTLRPEFVCNYRKQNSNDPFSLNADTMKDYSGLA